MWAPNSPDLNLVDNLWSTFGDKVDEEKDQTSTILGLERNLKTAWKKIYFSPCRIQAVLDAKGHIFLNKLKYTYVNICISLNIMLFSKPQILLRHPLQSKGMFYGFDERS